MTMFVLCSHLEYFKSETFIYSPKDVTLDLQVSRTFWSVAQLSIILSHYSSLEAFVWEVMYNPDTVPLLAAKCSGTLRSLTVGGGQQMTKVAFLQQCGMSLRTLELDCGHTKWRPLELIAASCPRLIALTLRNYYNWEEETALSAAFRDLKELSTLWCFFPSECLSKTTPASNTCGEVGTEAARVGWHTQSNG